MKCIWDSLGDICDASIASELVFKASYIAWRILDGLESNCDVPKGTWDGLERILVSLKSICDGLDEIRNGLEPSRIWDNRKGMGDDLEGIWESQEGIWDGVEAFEMV